MVPNPETRRRFFSVDLNPHHPAVGGGVAVGLVAAFATAAVLVVRRDEETHKEWESVELPNLIGNAGKWLRAKVMTDGFIIESSMVISQGFTSESRGMNEVDRTRPAIKLSTSQQPSSSGIVLIDARTPTHQQIINQTVESLAALASKARPGQKHVVIGIVDVGPNNQPILKVSDVKVKVV